MRRKTYYRDDDWVPSPRDLTAKDVGRVSPKRLAVFAATGNPLRKSPEAWAAFVADVRRNGVKNPIMVFVRPDRGAFIDEGNHRLAAALECGRRTVPVEIYYYGGTERTVGSIGRSRA